MSTTTSSAVLLPSPSESQPEPAPRSGPVLAVLVEGHPFDDLLERASTLARARGTVVHPVLLRARAPFSADPALIPLLARRRRDDVDRVQRALAACTPPDGLPWPELLVLPRPPLPQSVRRARRAIEAVARRRAAAVVVIPPPLAALATRWAGHGTEVAVVVVGGAR